METMENSLEIRPIYYIYGNVDGKNKVVETEMEDVCAKEVVNETVETSRFFIKRGPDGVFNPLTLDERMHNRYTKKGLYKWCLVNRQAFDLYLQFLRTGKNQFLHQSERLF